VTHGEPIQDRPASRAMADALSRPQRSRLSLVVLSVSVEVVDGHLVAEAGGRFLLDTGSPMSFARTGEVVWAGRDHEVATNLLGLDSPELSDLVGTPLDGLLGGDVLGESPFTVDLERGTCFFDETPTDRDGIELQLRLVLGVPFASLEFDGLPTATCIDTGAKLSYLERGRLAGTEVVGEADDFYPGLGAFRTAIHEVPVRIAASMLTLRIGELPDALAVQLSMLGLAAILGTEILDHFPTVTFDYPASVARLYPLN